MALFELTLAIIKPHIIKNPIALAAIREMIITSNLKIVRSKRHKFTRKESELFYNEHRNRFFYNRLVTFMMSGASDFYILAGFDAIKRWRQLMGPTKVFKTQYEAPNTIRGQFGLSDTRNATHGSDSVESVRKELQIVYPDFNINQWYKDEEPYFRQNQLEFDPTHFIHKIKDL